MTLSTLCYLLAVSNKFLHNVSQYGNISLITGSFCGAIIYTLNLHQVSVIRRATVFFVSFLLGVGCSDSTTHFLANSLDTIITPPPELNRTFMAALTAAVAVRMINALSALLCHSLIKREEIK